MLSLTSGTKDIVGKVASSPVRTSWPEISLQSAWPDIVASQTGPKLEADVEGHRCVGSWPDLVSNERDASSRLADGSARIPNASLQLPPGRLSSAAKLHEADLDPSPREWESPSPSRSAPPSSFRKNVLQQRSESSLLGESTVRLVGQEMSLIRAAPSRDSHARQTTAHVSSCDDPGFACSHTSHAKSSLHVYNHLSSCMLMDDTLAAVVRVRCPMCHDHTLLAAQCAGFCYYCYAICLPYGVSMDTTYASTTMKEWSKFV